MTLEMMIALALLVLVVLLLCALLLRRPRVALPPEWPQRLQALESAVQATQLAVAKNDGALDAMGQQLRGFTHSTQVLLDERLQLAAQESRTSRAELQAAFGALQQRLEHQLVQGRSDEAQARGEQLQALAVFRTELTQTAQALKEGRIAAAGLDVFEGEPAVHTGLLERSNVVLTPHIASATVPTRLAMARLAADNLVAFFDGRGALTPVNTPNQ